jgi:hypothetical protein
MPDLQISCEHTQQIVSGTGKKGARVPDDGKRRQYSSPTRSTCNASRRPRTIKQEVPFARRSGMSRIYNNRPLRERLSHSDAARLSHRHHARPRHRLSARRSVFGEHNASRRQSQRRAAGSQPSPLPRASGLRFVPQPFPRHHPPPRTQNSLTRAIVSAWPPVPRLRLRSQRLQSETAKQSMRSPQGTV